VRYVDQRSDGPLEPRTVSVLPAQDNVVVD